MKTKITNLLVALVATLAIASTASAQQQTVISPAIVGQPQELTVMPVLPQNQFYFGMRVELVQNWGGATLRVVGVDYGSPAQRAGLEFGDEIRTVNGQSFYGARDSFDAVRMMNQFVSQNTIYPTTGPSAPAAAAYIMPRPRSIPFANMIVRNVRNGQDVSVTVHPTRRGYGGVAAAASAAPSVVQN